MDPYFYPEKFNLTASDNRIPKFGRHAVKPVLKYNIIQFVRSKSMIFTKYEFIKKE